MTGVEAKIPEVLRRNKRGENIDPWGTPTSIDECRETTGFS